MGLAVAEALLSGPAEIAIVGPEDDPRTAPPQPHGDVACKRKLGGVREEIQDNLLPHLPVDIHRRRQRRARRSTTATTMPRSS